MDTLTYASGDWVLFWIDIGVLFRIFSIGVFWKRSGCSDVFTYIVWLAQAAEVQQGETRTGLRRRGMDVFSEETFSCNIIITQSVFSNKIIFCDMFEYVW